MKLFNGNPRTITRKQFKRLQETLDELGDLSGIVHDLNSDQIIGGNQRSTVFDVAKMRPVITEELSEPNRQGTVARGYVEWHGERFSYRAVRWTEAQCRKGNIIANIAGGDWNFDDLAGWNEPLTEWGFDEEKLKDWNVDGAALSKMLEAESATGDADAEPQIDRAAELNEKWQVKTGDLWRIGEHRLLCGDSTKRDDVERVMRGEKADCVVTDPPYGVGYDGGTTKREELEGDENPDLYFPFLNLIKNFCNDSVALYLWYADGDQVIAQAVAQAGWIIRRNLIWNKNQAQFGALSQQYHQKHEPFLYCHIKGKSPYWAGDATEVTVWDIARDSSNELHPTQKPAVLFERAIKNSSTIGSIVVDGFSGSGPALVASQNLSRKCRAIEKKPPFCAVILERMATAFPGIEIERIEDDGTS